MKRREKTQSSAWRGILMPRKVERHKVSRSEFSKRLQPLWKTIAV